MKKEIKKQRETVVIEGRLELINNLIKQYEDDGFNVFGGVKCKYEDNNECFYYSVAMVKEV